MVLLMDALGFRQLVKECSDNPDELNRLLGKLKTALDNAVGMLGWIFTLTGDGLIPWGFKSFTDNVAMSSPIAKSGREEMEFAIASACIFRPDSTTVSGASRPPRPVASDH